MAIQPQHSALVDTHREGVQTIMMKPITGQYECVHSSGVGLDYFTSRIDRLILQANGRFTLIIQDRSRLSNAAQSLASGQQVSTAAPETRREGNYTQQDNNLMLHFDGGGMEPGQLSWNGEGLQLGPNFFTKVSDSTLLPPTHRLKKDMDDIAKGLKIASTIGGMAVKAVKTIQGTIQAVQPAQEQVPAAGPQQGNMPPPQPMPAQPAQNQAPAPQPFQQQAAPRPVAPSAQPVRNQTPPAAPQPNPAPGQAEGLFCDQCGARSRPGKRFCSNCGAQLM